ncbi:hypothetical protein EVAR_43317_1 [Eumeta japonica]|uniref:Reverse transcriptase domain-containing protein n=1 Tax=Eumeta variegata TaxID=151549 RepID=A0A4C1WR56_EUMVA|nr:hypothetical protein EVAR_43317_1 [Eumeta japonica]
MTRVQVLEVSPELYHRLIKPALYTWGSKAPGMGPVPVGAVFALSRIRTWQAFCKEVSERCAHRRGAHWHVTWRAKGWRAPKCVNCTKTGCEDTAHGAFSSECRVRAKWMIWLGRRWRTASSRRPGPEDRTHTAEGSSTEGCTDRVSLRFMQSNLQRSAESSKDGSAEDPSKHHNDLNSDVDVEEDQTLNGENVAAAVIKAGNCRIGVVSVYFGETCPCGWRDDRPRPLSTQSTMQQGSMVQFAAAMHSLNERTLTTEMVKSVGSCDQLDELLRLTPNASDKHDAAIPRKSSNTWTETPWWSPELEGLKRDARTKKRRIRNAAPAGGVRGRGDGEPVGRHLQGSSGKREKPGGCPIKTDSGQVIGSGRVSDPLAETFFPDDRVDTDDPYHTEAPGIDGFISDICQAAIFRDLGLFLAMANKCLELGYFPEPGRWRQSRGAFDNAWWPALETQLRALGCPVNLHGLVRGYLRDREVVVKYAGGSAGKGLQRVVYKAFADDVVLMFSGQSASSIEEEANRALARVLLGSQK